MPQPVALVCRAAEPGLYQRLRERPSLAFACAGLLNNEAQRDQVLRAAFVENPQGAQKYLPAILDRPWITDAGFFELTKLAIAADSRELLTKAAKRYPAIALREYRTYLRQPFGQAALDQAVLAAPDEAVGLATGNSVTAKDIRGELSRFPDLARLVAEPGIPDAVRQKMAVLVGPLSFAAAREAASGPRFFGTVANLRVKSSPENSQLYDRVLENYAEVLFREAQDSGVPSELSQLSARDVYFLLCYGRSEADDLLFGKVYDSLLAPKLRTTPPSRLLEDAGWIAARRFLSSAADHHRLDTFLAADGPKSELAARALRGLETAERPLDEALDAAEFVGDVRDRATLIRLQSVIAAEYARSEKSKPLYGLLAAAVVRKAPAAAWEPTFASIAADFQPYFQEPRTLDAAALFDPTGLSVQQQFFYDDDDAAESFLSFRETYQRDRTWKWIDHDWYVEVTGGIPASRHIRIFANVPRSINPTAGEPGDRRHALNKVVTDLGLTPSVLIHRGHTWYVEQSLRYLTPGCRLVYLGSCRGMLSAYSVILQANRAQMIATRGVGTQTINDPLLKALNDDLLRGGKTLDWEKFWAVQQTRLGHNPDFRDYVPPPRNSSAIMLAAYYDYLARLP